MTRSQVIAATTGQQAIVRGAALLLALLAALALALGVWASPAAAHDTLVDSNPAEGETLDAAPGQAELGFSAEISPVGVAFALRDAQGNTLDLPAVAQVEGVTVTQPLPAIGGGDYLLDWRVVSSDGHPISGTIGFAVAASVVAPTTAAPAPVATTAAPSPSAAPTAVATATPAVVADGDDTGAEGLPLWGVIVIGVGGVAVIAAAAIGVAARLRRQQP